MVLNIYKVKINKIMSDDKYREYALVDPKTGKDIEGHVFSSKVGPRAAARKAAKIFLPKGKPGKVTVYLRQTSRKRGHNKFKAYEVKQEIVDAPKALLKLRGDLKGKKNAKVSKRTPKKLKMNKMPWEK
jgi:hypothetical protein